MEEYVAGASLKRTAVSAQAATEEEFFLGLRLTRGVDLKEIARKFGEAAVEKFAGTISECVDLKLLEREGNVIRLTGRGRLLSNEVFERFIGTADTALVLPQAQS
jgi:oxygen-independent coproporphyrinogen-3 oxidase